ncbi:MAG: hypothetical protein CMH64_04055 [Nanoarchaeota archaeon]|nr:hypothetical protein [Nanoarchaeota archaeon]|tara:strand:+ start:473 stop:847 length:375 start_codon:yes stop_codon:yes gene_type:complete
MVRQIIKTLSETKGLDNVNLLKEEIKDIIRNLENDSNEGVISCLDRKYTLVLTHDSNFRDPVREIVKKENGEITFPPIPFPEVKATNVVSSSPSKEVHDFLVKEFNLTLEDDATLLIGFDSGIK